MEQNVPYTAKDIIWSLHNSNIIYDIHNSLSVYYKTAFIKVTVSINFKSTTNFGKSYMKIFLPRTR